MTCWMGIVREGLGEGYKRSDEAGEKKQCLPHKGGSFVTARCSLES